MVRLWVRTRVMVRLRVRSVFRVEFTVRLGSVPGFWFTVSVSLHPRVMLTCWASLLSASLLPSPHPLSHGHHYFFIHPVAIPVAPSESDRNTLGSSRRVAPSGCYVVLSGRHHDIASPVTLGSLCHTSGRPSHTRLPSQHSTHPHTPQSGMPPHGPLKIHIHGICIY